MDRRGDEEERKRTESRRSRTSEARKQPQKQAAEISSVVFESASGVLWIGDVISRHRSPPDVYLSLTIDQHTKEAVRIDRMWLRLLQLQKYYTWHGT